MTAEDMTRASTPEELDAMQAGNLVTGEGFGGEEEGPSDLQMRADLRARGHKPTERGRLGRDWVEIWESGETAPGLGDGGEDADDGTGGVGPADFGPGPGPQARPERPPSKPRARRLRDRLGVGEHTTGKRRSGQEKTGPRTAKPKHERVPLDRLGEGAFGVLARVTRTADPVLSRTFTLEAPIAGYVADRTLKGTLADRVLQPVARAQLKANVLGALLGMPVGVVLLEQAQTLPEGPRAMREGLILAGMRECAVVLAEFMAEDMSARMEREAERETRYAEADAMLQFILYGVTPAAAGEPAPEDQAAAAAQQEATPGAFGGFMAPPPAGDPARPAYDHPYSVTSAVALRP